MFGLVFSVEFRLEGFFSVAQFRVLFRSELGGESEKTENKKKEYEKFLGVRYKLVFGSFRVFEKGE